MRHITIESIHVGKLSLDLFGKKWYMPNQIGVLKRQDIGKRIYRVRTNDSSDFILQMENDEQRAKRIEKESVSTE